MVWKRARRPFAGGAGSRRRKAKAPADTEGSEE